MLMNRSGDDRSRRATMLRSGRAHSPGVIVTANPKHPVAEFSDYNYTSFVNRELITSILRALPHGVVRLLSKEHSKRPYWIDAPPQWQGDELEGV